MKRSLSLLVAMVFSFMTVGLAMASEGADKKTENGPEVIVLKTKKKGDVTFKHLEHQKKSEGKCGECHHGKGPDAKQIPYVKGQEIQKCDACHNKDMANAKLNTAQKAFHKNCKDCHKEKAAEVHAKKCAACHPKKAGEGEAEDEKEE